MRHDVVRLTVYVFKQIRRNQEREKLAVPHHFFNIFTEAFSGGQKLVVPDRNVAEFGNVMNDLHKLVCIMTVLFAVTQKDVRIERLADFFRHFIADEHGFQIFFQLFFIADGGHILHIRAQILRFPKFRGIKAVQSRFHHDGQNGNMLFAGITKIGIHRAALFAEQLERHGHDEQVHLTKVAFLVLFFDFLGHAFRIIDRAIVCFENVLADFFKMLFKILGVTSEIYAGLSLGRGISPRFVKKVRHCKTPFCQFLLISLL